MGDKTPYLSMTQPEGGCPEKDLTAFRLTGRARDQAAMILL